MHYILFPSKLSYFRLTQHFRPSVLPQQTLTPSHPPFCKISDKRPRPLIPRTPPTNFYTFFAPNIASTLRPVQKRRGTPKAAAGAYMEKTHTRKAHKVAPRLKEERVRNMRHSASGRSSGYTWRRSVFIPNRILALPTSDYRTRSFMTLIRRLYQVAEFLPGD